MPLYHINFNTYKQGHNLKIIRYIALIATLGKQVGDSSESGILEKAAAHSLINGSFRCYTPEV